MTRSSKLGIHSGGLNFFLPVSGLRKLEINPLQKQALLLHWLLQPEETVVESCSCGKLNMFDALRRVKEVIYCFTTLTLMTRSNIRAVQISTTYE
jgi:hypothetical protein